MAFSKNYSVDPTVDSIVQTQRSETDKDYGKEQNGSIFPLKKTIVFKRLIETSLREKFAIRSSDDRLHLDLTKNCSILNGIR